MRHRNVLLMDNEHGKLFVFKQLIVYQFMPKIRQNTPGPKWGDYVRSLRPSSRNGAYFKLEGGGGNRG